MLTWERVVELARELPEVEESTSFGAPTFRVRGNAFAGVSRHEGIARDARRQDGRVSRASVCNDRSSGSDADGDAVRAIWTRCDRDERSLIVDSNPELYRLTPRFERSPGYLLIWLEDATEVDVRERLLDAWLLAAPKRLAASMQ